MKKSVSLAVLCLSLGTALPAAAQTQQQGQQFEGQQTGQQTGQQQFGQQMPGQQQRLSEQRIRNFFEQAENVLQQTARTQDPDALRQYLSQYMAPQAEIMSISELYLGDRHVATTVAQATDETVTDALGYAATALQGRKLVSDYDIEINVRDIQMMPGQNAARVRTVIQEEGMMTGPIARRVAGRIGEARERIGQLREQWQQQDQGQWSQSAEPQMGQLGQRLQQRWGQMQDGQSQEGMGMGMGFGPGRGGGAEQEGIHFRTRANCTHDILLEQGQMRIGNTFCRGTTRLGS